MKLTEHDGKELLRSYGIETPRGERIERGEYKIIAPFPVVLKSQVLVGDRKKKGGILVVSEQKDASSAIDTLFSRLIDGSLPEYLLAEEFVKAEMEWYVSFSYSSECRSPVLALSSRGGSGIAAATITEIDVLEGCSESTITSAITRAEMTVTEQAVQAIQKLWSLFEREKLLLAEINPLFVLHDGRVIAGDAKIVRDDSLLPLVEKEVVPLGGDIAIIASGGGASMLNIDMLMRAGGMPANYVEYSGNPSASVVEALTIRVLSQPSLRGAWVIGGTANFTDTYETMMGFVSGLRQISPKPKYPIVVRRDGPRLAEARAMLERVARDEAYQLYIYGSEISMQESATILLSKI